jgi:cobalt-precorrin-5B (C1)-methyltransferase
MSLSPPGSGYTLPAIATAAAIAACRWLQRPQTITAVEVDLIEPAKIVEIEIEQVAGIKDKMALAIARSDPGDNLDLTRNTPVWALVELKGEQESGRVGEQISLKGGEGVGRIVDRGDRPAIYAYAQKLLRANLQRWLSPTEKIEVTIILPEGRSLATRTSNAAFGVVDGLSLLGTSGISQPLSAPDYLEFALEELRSKVKSQRGAMLCARTKVKSSEAEVSPLTPSLPHSLTPSLPHSLTPSPSPLVFCVGENGIDLAQKLGIDRQKIIKTANWLGPMLVEAGWQQVPAILLFGYHGKLIKLAGGIFHTHHHLADGRLEILTAHGVRVGLPTPALQEILHSATAEDALQYLRQLDAEAGSNWVERVYQAIAENIDRRCQAYIRTHSQGEVTVGSVLFDRDRQIIVTSAIGTSLWSQLC